MTIPANSPFLRFADMLPGTQKSDTILPAGVNDVTQRHIFFNTTSPSPVIPP